MKQLIRIILVLSMLLGGVSWAQSSREMTRIIDQLVYKKLDEQGIALSKRLDDEAFVRRIYLDVVGRIPTLAETKTFLASKHTRKREVLIDKLFDSAGYVSHNFNYWADVLRATTRMRNISGQPYIQYIKDSIRENKPYDKFVQELLSAEGAIYKDSNGATGYYMRDAGMPLDNMSNSMQIFLGTSMVCAQCHDHPFDRWTQMDFYKLAAFTSGVKANRNNANRKDPAMKPIFDLRKDARSDPKLNRTSRQFFDVLYASVNNNGTGMIYLPHDYDYEDAKPYDVIKAGVPYGPKVSLSYEEEKKSKKKKTVRKRKNMPAPGQPINSRHAFAEWVTSNDNPMFTKVIVNRMWDKYMGAPLVGPLLNTGVKSYGANKELTEALMKYMQSTKFDLREFSKSILKSRAYQRVAISEDLDPKAKNYFAGPVLRRLTSEQLWDSLMSLALEDPDSKLPKKPKMDTRQLIYAKHVKMAPDKLAGVIRDASKDSKNYFKSLSKEANSMNMNTMMASMSMTATTSPDKQYKSLKSEYGKLRKQAQKANKKGDKTKAKKLYTEAKLLQTKMEEARGQMMINNNKKRREFVRASEVESPARASHFLRRFGQSERNIIDGKSTEASIPQALTLLNGKVEDYLINSKYSIVNRSISEGKTAEDKVKEAYLSILSRQPNAKELSMFAQRFKKDESQASKDIIWVLVNSNEFLFNK
ncbi:MAG: DUF1549 and DUF1553 domain-containing protein [Lentisphaeraceae bacterium]|nr:DUF1549 and DUF1553 domain-containing protein [Lentisphaeraceae bacterium]